MWRKKAGLYLGFLIIAGFLALLVVQLLLCLWPLVHAPSLAAAFLAALAYVSAAVLSGLAATRFFWNPSRMSPSSSLQPVCAHQRSRLDLDTFRRVVVPAGLNRRSSAGGNGGRAHGDWSGKSPDAGWRDSSEFVWLENGGQGVICPIAFNPSAGGTRVHHCALYLRRVLCTAQARDSSR